MKSYMGVEVKFQSFITSVLHAHKWSNYVPAAAFGAQWSGDYAVFRTGLDVVAVTKTVVPARNWIPSVHIVPSHYTDPAIRFIESAENH
jgi:hypothetical protein